MALLVLLLSCSLLSAALGQRCPDKPGFVTRADTNWAVNAKTRDAQAKPAANAEQICALDENCLAFNSFGYYLTTKDDATQPTIAATGVQLSSYSGLCTYIKASALPAACPDKPGFVTRADTNWAVNAKTRDAQAKPAANAQQICALDQNCIAFNSFGYYLTTKDGASPTITATGVQLSPYSGLCTYIKASALASACPDKAGYASMPDTNWVKGAKTQESQTQPANAEQICNLDANCIAFNSFGYYILRTGSAAAPTVAATGITFQPYNGLCTFVKRSASGQQPVPQMTPQQVPQPFMPSWQQQQQQQQQQAQAFVFRNAATQLCFAASGPTPRLALLSSLSLEPCAPRAASQAFQVVPVGNSGFQIIDNRGRCLTFVEGLLLDRASLTACGRNRADQLWSFSGNKGPVAIKSRAANKCIVNERRMVEMDSCSTSDSNGLFEAAPWM